MKHTIKMLLILYTVCLSSLSWANWTQDGGSLNVSTGLDSAYPSIAVGNGSIYVAWEETNGTTLQVYVKHWNGSTWVQNGGSLNINTSQSAQLPCITIANGIPYIAWSEYNGAQYQIYVKHWTGTAWVQDGGSLNVDTSTTAGYASIVIGNNTPYVAWTEFHSIGAQIYVKHWTGTTWVQDGGSLNINTNNNGGYSSLGISNGEAYVSWQENNQDYMKHWNGSAWQSVGGSFGYSYPSVAIYNGTPYVASWDGSYIVVRHWNGASWIQDGNSFSASVTNTWYHTVCLSIYNGIPYVAWNQSTGNVFVHHLEGSNWIQDGSCLNVNSGNTARCLGIAFNGSTPYVAWNEKYISNYQIYVKHYVPPTLTPTITYTSTFTPTTTPTMSPTFTQTPTITSTPTVTPTSTNSPVASVTSTSTVSPTPSITLTPIPSVANFQGEILDGKYFYVAPNPTKGAEANFKFFLQQSAEVEIRIYTPQGSHVLTKAFHYYSQGWNTCVWNASGMANGVYFYIVEAKANGVTEKLKVKKLALIK